MSAEAELLEHLVTRAQRALVNVFGLAVASDLGRAELAYMLRLPEPVQRAYQSYREDLRAVAVVIAAQQGDVEALELLPEAKRIDYLRAAAELVTETPFTPVSHAALPVRGASVPVVPAQRPTVLIAAPPSSDDHAGITEAMDTVGHLERLTWAEQVARRRWWRR